MGNNCEQNMYEKDDASDDEHDRPRRAVQGFIRAEHDSDNYQKNRAERDKKADHSQKVFQPRFQALFLKKPLYEVEISVKYDLKKQLQKKLQTIPLTVCCNTDKVLPYLRRTIKTRCV